MRAFLMAAALAALSIAGPATAATVFKITLEGVVTLGFDAYDTLGLGSAGGLTGQAISASFFVHGDAPGVTEPYDSPVVSSLFGSGAVSTKILLAGRTFQVGGNRSDTYLYQYHDPGLTELLDIYVNDGRCSSTTCAFSSATAHADTGPFLPGRDWRDLPGADLGGASYRGGSFFYASFDAGFVNPTDLSVYFDWDRATVSIPEPGAWALMILGFGLAGVTLRRRRVASA